jgi:hypothetical protein
MVRLSPAPGKSATADMLAAARRRLRQPSACCVRSSPIVAVGGITLPAIRLSGMLTVGDIRDAVQELRDSSVEELRRPLAGVFAGAKGGRYYRYRHPGTKVETTTGWARWPTCWAQEPNGAS